MKAWIVVLINYSEPEQKVYLIGAHSTLDAARSQQQQLNSGSSDENKMAQVVEMAVDGKQAPILVGVAPKEASKDCKKNTPNG